MNPHILTRRLRAGALGVALATAAGASPAAPQVTRLTPPSELFNSGAPSPVISRFLPGQRFDLQATVIPDTGATIKSVRFSVDGRAVRGTVTLKIDGLIPSLPAGTTVASLRAHDEARPGLHTLRVTAVQSDGQSVSREGNFEVQRIKPGGKKVKNIIIMLGDGMGAAHRTAARIVANGVTLGKAKAPLAMDTFPVTGMVMTASLNSIVTDSAPGMSNYVTGNKANNNEEGVWPDDTADPFDNPRVEYLSEFLHRTRGTSLGLVTTADVFDATPAANAVHTADRGAGTGIVDQYLDDRNLTGLKVLMGGGRKWFLPNLSNSIKPQPANGSQRRNATDYVLPADIASAWGAAPGRLDPERDLIADFTAAGFKYVSNATELAGVTPGDGKVLGLFAYSNMNVALDKIGKRRGTSSVVDDYGFPDQPMLDEMTQKALEVLGNDRSGFVLMIEGASIDKQAHNMDSERWILDTIEFDRAIKVARDFAKKDGETLVIVTADHECSGAAIIGASLVSNADLIARSTAGGGTIKLRKEVVGNYETAGFPKYTTAGDGYPATTDIDRKLLIGYGANADRYEDWLTNPRPIRDSQQPFNGAAPLDTYPSGPLNRDIAGGFLITGQVEGATAVHTGSDVPLSAFGPGARLFTGVMDNTDVFFKIGQIVIGGVGNDPREDE